MTLTADRVSFAYPRGPLVLREVSLDVGGGAVTFLLGANGSGKTTLLNCLSGLQTPSSGEVRIDGRRLTEVSPRERAQRIGVVPQLHDPIFPFTVAEAVLMGRAPHLGFLDRPGPADRQAVDAVLDEVGLATLRHTSTLRLSGGERQLVLIARGLAQGARCLLMDEPAAHLDPRHAADVFGVVRRLAAGGLSFLVSSHDPNDALLYAAHVVFLKDGAVVRSGPPAEAMAEDTLRQVYGVELRILEGAAGERAVLPRLRNDP
jgi:iron complex transport system ATP-binding protein